MSILIREVQPADEQQWTELYRGYRDFYRLEHDAAKIGTTWQWVSHGEHGLTGLVAEDERGALLGLANLRRFARPSSATIGLYLDDLFTTPSARGAGVGTALLRAASDLAAREGASLVRWITAEDNTTARRVYDTVATATPWVTYDMAPSR